MKIYSHVFLIAVSACLFSLACTKKINTQLFWGDIWTPKNISLGQPILSRVQLQYQTTSFPVNFNGFHTIEKLPHHYSITAPATITSHGESSANTSLWILDTSYVLPTNTAGTYILDFIFQNEIKKSDTVFVQ